MGIISWIIIGLIAGAIAKLLMPGKGPKGCIITVLLGIGGAFLGGWIGSQLGFGTVKGLDLKSILIAAGGSFLILIIYKAIKQK